LVSAGCAWEQFLAFVEPVAAFQVPSEDDAAPDAALVETVEPSVVPFGVGEYLEFSVSYNVIQAGTATLSVDAIEEIGGHECYRLVSTTRSNGFVSTFFEVKDDVQSFMDVHGLFSRKFERHLREGDYVKDEVVYIEEEAGMAYYDDGDTVDVQPSSQDALSALYFVRTLDLKVGTTVAFPNHTGKKNYPMRVLVLGKEKIKTPAGRFTCIVVEPRLKAAGIFKHKGKLTVWISDDERRIPVMMKSKVTIGAITATLTRWRPGRPLGADAEETGPLNGSDLSP
jgi:hypothetical protein